MPEFDLIIYESEFRRFEKELKRLRSESNSRAVFLISGDGQLIASAGETGGLDTTGLATLAAANLAAAGEIARSLGQRQFSGFLLEGEGGSIQISPVGERLILVVLFDNRTSVGLVRLRVKKAGRKFLDIQQAIAPVSATSPSLPAGGHFAGITDEDLDNLFRAL
ncbi:MAG: roadblock/LC7 domain-containing protein [Nitrospiraceae bacterium]|nr:roadblock/LC7 domain-containing protein [Nitrospiraceae bacterium]